MPDNRSTVIRCMQWTGLLLCGRWRKDIHMTGKLNIALRMVVYPEGKWWIAHCLETDIVAEGKTPEGAMRDLYDLCRFQVDVAMKEGDLDSVFRPAPPATWRMFFMGTRKRTPRKRAGPVEKFEARQLTPA